MIETLYAELNSICSSRGFKELTSPGLSASRAQHVGESITGISINLQSDSSISDSSRLKPHGLRNLADFSSPNLKCLSNRIMVYVMSTTVCVVEIRIMRSVGCVCVDGW